MNSLIDLSTSQERQSLADRLCTRIHQYRREVQNDAVVVQPGQCSPFEDVWVNENVSCA